MNDINKEVTDQDIKRLILEGHEINNEKLRAELELLDLKTNRELFDTFKTLGGKLNRVTDYEVLATIPSCNPDLDSIAYGHSSSGDLAIKKCLSMLEEVLEEEIERFEAEREQRKEEQKEEQREEQDRKERMINNFFKCQERQERAVKEQTKADPKTAHLSGKIHFKGITLPEYPYFRCSKTVLDDPFQEKEKKEEDSWTKSLDIMTLAEAFDFMIQNPKKNTCSRLCHIDEPILYYMESSPEESGGDYALVKKNMITGEDGEALNMPSFLDSQDWYRLN